MPSSITGGIAENLRLSSASMSLKSVCLIDCCTLTIVSGGADVGYYGGKRDLGYRLEDNNYGPRLFWRWLLAFQISKGDDRSDFTKD
jgi:hypothetical protein